MWATRGNDSPELSLRVQTVHLKRQHISKTQVLLHFLRTVHSSCLVRASFSVSMHTNNVLE